MASKLNEGMKILTGRTVSHPMLPQNSKLSKGESPAFSFVIGADPQLGIASGNQEWDTEMKYSIEAVDYINNLDPKPAFVTMCGDLVDMEADMFTGPNFTRAQCIDIQNQQWNDYLRIWSKLDPSIPLLCLCGNHDVGNAPSPDTIERYKNAIGDDYYSFWYKDCFFVCLNTNMYNDNSNCQELYDVQNEWLENSLKNARKKAKRIFLFGHHPWFLNNEKEVCADITGRNHFPEAFRADKSIPDAYFFIRLEYRKFVMDLCKKYKVDACFAGHYHQNLISQTSWGMPMITTGPICNWILNSTAKDQLNPQNATVHSGVRIIRVDDAFPQGFTHCYECIPEKKVSKNGKKKANSTSKKEVTTVGGKKRKINA